jgi:hypothetical protein
MSRNGMQRTARPTFCQALLRRDGSYEIDARSRNTAIASERGALCNLARDGAESLNQRLAFCAVVDHEGVVFSVC